MAQVGASIDARSPLRVLVVAEHALVGESVRAALSARGCAPVVGRRDPRGRADVGMLLTHSFGDTWVEALGILERVTLPWLVLASDERGPTWGAFYLSGATLVVPPSAGLEEVYGALHDLAAGATPPGHRGRAELIRLWRESLRRRHELNERLTSLTPREEQVLRELHDGLGVRHIAELAEVAEATVRTQVKAILRKLDVSSQIAAVAAYAQVSQPPQNP